MKGCGKNLRKWYFDDESEVCYWKCGDENNGEILICPKCSQSNEETN